MIKSQRTFGVELEMGIPSSKGKDFAYNAVDKLHEKARKLGWDIGEDISIKDLYSPLEARSPILSGSQGEANFREFCTYASSLGFVTNQTCGTHVHLGGEDYSKRENLKEVTMGEFIDNSLQKGFSPGIAFDMDAYEILLNSSGESFNEFVVQANNDEDFSVSCPLKDGRYSRLVRAQLYIPEFDYYVNIVLKRSKLIKILGEEVEELDGAVIVLGKDIQVEEVIFLSRKIKDNVGILKNLFMFYTAFDSVLFAMLPKSRRIQNRFCKPLSYSYSYSKITGIRSMGQLEKMWYSRNSTSDLVNAKREHKHISRRHSVNLHSLLGGIGTVEIRLHDGSLDTNELLNWIELHQFILDTIALDYMNREICELAAQSNDLETKVKHMFDTIGIPSELRSYIISQIKKNK